MGISPMFRATVFATTFLVGFSVSVAASGGDVPAPAAIPLDQAAADCDILVGIDVNGDPSEKMDKVDHRALDVWFGSAQIMMHSLTAHMMAAYPPDVYVRPHLSVFGALEFWRVKEIMASAQRDKDNFKRHLAHKVEQFIMKTGETNRAGD